MRGRLIMVKNKKFPKTLVNPKKLKLIVGTGHMGTVENEAASGQGRGPHAAHSTCQKPCGPQATQDEI